MTSELDMEPLQVYHTYHNLWKIEESFRITKSYLDARPVYVQKKETIYGHFLICYLSLFLLRILEIKCFKNEINSYDLVNFMRDFRVVDKGDGTYINISQNQRVNEKIKKLIGLTNLDALYLTEKEIENIFENSDFILMLNQAAGDRQILAKQLNISPYQLSYVTNSGEGEGLLFYGTTIIPFKDKFDKTLKLYGLMTTKPEETLKRDKEMRDANEGNR